MATEKRLIDANELRQRIESRIYWGQVNNVACLEAIDDAPTVDAVEVVRCNDCRCNEECSIQDAMNWTPRENIGDWFCSYGERREGE